MSTDIRINTSFLQHPKTIKLRKRLGDGAVLSMLSLWCFVAQNRPEGALLGMDEEDIEISAQWLGENGMFVDTLIDLQWLDKKDGVYHIHDWAENNPWVADAENRSAKAKKAINKRWERERIRKEEEQNAYASNTDVLPENAVSNTPPPPLPLPTLPFKEEDVACERMALSEAQQLHIECLGKIPFNPLSVTVLREICNEYPPDRIRIAFKAIVSADKPNLNWIKTYLDNPKNWNKGANNDSRKSNNGKPSYDSCENRDYSAGEVFDRSDKW